MRTEEELVIPALSAAPTTALEAAGHSGHGVADVRLYAVACAPAWALDLWSCGDETALFCQELPSDLSCTTR